LNGTTISHYEVLERLGSGGMGVVHKARDLTLDRLVALKFLSPHRGTEADRRRFLREARAASALEHPNICTIYEVGEAEDGRLFIAMSLCEGESLKEKLERGPLPPEEAVRLAAGIAAGLAAAHARGVVHRDVKPGNVMILPDGQVKLVDFGIAKLAEETRLTRAGSVVGTASYLSPEQFRGEPADHRADVWALGVLLYEMLTGRLPFDAPHDHELIDAILRREPEPPSIHASGVPYELDRLVQRALAKRPELRHPNMESLRADLERLLENAAELGKTVVAIPSSRPQPLPRPSAPGSQSGSRSGSRSGPWPDVRRESSSLAAEGAERYQILEPVGGGGMGVVYKARDLRLGRIVALKFLPPELTRDPEAKERFLQEARTASTLDHPNVCTVHEIGEDADGRLFLAMAFYDGETLKKRLGEGPLPVDEAADIAKQVAQGLTKAHRQGIIHRDVKPANLMLTGDGVVKILDFGIAKLAGSAALGLTRAGSSVGTPAYMSPEQARGEEVDGRSDVWSLGAVLYEMLAGRRPFPGDHDQAVIYAVLNEAPKPLGTLRVDVPEELARIVGRMLEKDPGQRYPSMAEVVADLRAFRNEPGTGTMQRTIAPPAQRRSWTALAVAGALLLAAGGALLVFARGAWRTPVQPTYEQLTRLAGRETFPTLAPDGKLFAYVKSKNGNADIYLQQAGGDPKPIADSPVDDTQPAFSPDGQRIAFRSEREGGGIFVMGILGGTARRVSSLGYNPSWSPDGRDLVVATEGVASPFTRRGTSELWRIDIEAGERRRVTAGDAVQPSWSPHGQRIAYWSVPKSGRRILWTIPAGGGEPHQVTDDTYLNWNPVWSPDGRYLYFSTNRLGTMNLWRIAIDETSGETQGEPEAVTTPCESCGMLSFSRDGLRMVYATDDSESNLERVGFDPARLTAVGDPVAITEGSRSISSGEVSPRGDWIVYQVTEPREDLYVVRTDGSEPRQLTDDKAKDRVPRWAPDGSSILFYSNVTGRYEAWTIRPDGTGRERLTQTRGEEIFNPIWSPDMRRIVLGLGFRTTALLDLAAPPPRRTPRPLSLPAGFSASSWTADGSPNRSPDGGRLAGTLGGRGIAVYDFGTGRLERLTDRGQSPVWLPGGQALLYLDEGRVFALDLRTGRSQQVLAPRPNSEFRSVSPGPDGKTLYLVRSTDEGGIWMRSL
jgi:serine/threonine protein kinase/Tol biopolymer transport system component